MREKKWEEMMMMESEGRRVGPYLFRYEEKMAGCLLPMTEGFIE